MAHMDVVPAKPEKWDTDPFGANIIDGFVYARGTIDFKHGVMVIIMCNFCELFFFVGHLIS